MRKYVMPRGTGKTIVIIRDSMVSGATIVVTNQERKREVRRIINSEFKDCNIPEPITVYELLHSTGKKKNKNGYIVDDIEYLFDSLNIVGYSESCEDTSLYKK